MCRYIHVYNHHPTLPHDDDTHLCDVTFMSLTIILSCHMMTEPICVPLQTCLQPPFYLAISWRYPPVRRHIHVSHHHSILPYDNGTHLCAITTMSPTIILPCHMITVPTCVPLIHVSNHHSTLPYDNGTHLCAITTISPTIILSCHMITVPTCVPLHSCLQPSFYLAI